MNYPGPKSGKAKDKRIVIIGAGPGGICVGKMLLDAGFSDVTIFEKSPAAGGVWQHNIYPGAACDVPSDLYSFSFAQDYEWSRPYAGQAEIRDYMEWCVNQFGLSNRIHYNCEVVAMKWHDSETLWAFRLGNGEQSTADIVISAVGMFNLPHMPKLAGLDDFEGTLFHAAEWKVDHTLEDRRVAVIGSAASAVQIVPAIASTTQQLHVFQRTANWLLPKEDNIFDEHQLARRRTDRFGRRERRWQIWRDVVALRPSAGRI